MAGSEGAKRVRALLFDADGVVQRRPADWRETWQALLPEARRGPDSADLFLADVFAAEQPALVGADFREALERVAARWAVDRPLEDLLAVWTRLELDAGVVRAIRELRSSGQTCHLASNQEGVKAHHMSEVLGYRELFDREFYSCQLGVAKPERAFFEAILQALALDPEGVLLIDDRPENVEAARAVGLHAVVFPPNSGEAGLERALMASGTGPSQ